MSNIDSKENKKHSSLIKSLLITLIILFLLSLLILTLRLGNFLANGVDIFFIEPKEADVTFGDDESLWKDSAQIDIFYVENKNGEGVVTVVSGTGDKVIAPGTKGYYKFNFKNIGNIAVDYECHVAVSFDVSSIEKIEALPISIRLKNYQGEYLIGNENNWVSVSNITSFKDESIIGKNCYVYYELEWCWDFESGNDDLDTLLGNLSVNEIVKLVVDLSAIATQSEDLEAEGGIPLSSETPRTGGDINPIPYISLNVIILIILVVLLIFNKKARDLKSEELKKQISSINNDYEESETND